MVGVKDCKDFLMKPLVLYHGVIISILFDMLCAYDRLYLNAEHQGVQVSGGA